MHLARQFRPLEYSVVSETLHHAQVSKVSYRETGALGGEMDKSSRRVIQFLEKEIKTYAALSLFLKKKRINERMRVGDKRVLLSPTYYKDRTKEAKMLVNELRKAN
jgi:hypothetical protein